MIKILTNWLNQLFKKKEIMTLDLSKLSRHVSRLIIHCSATPPSMDIGADTINKWHTDKGWSAIGYHYVIKRDGVIENGRDVNNIGAHVKGHNTGSIGVCLIGGVDKNNKAEANFTDAQWETLAIVCKSFKKQLNYVTIHGHNEYAAKACPSFDVQVWLDKENI